MDTPPTRNLEQIIRDLQTETAHLQERIVEVERMLIPRLLDALQSPGQEAKAMEELRQLNPKSVVAAMLALLRSRRLPPAVLNVRRAIMWELGVQKTSEGVPELVAALDDETLRDTAIWSLGEIADPSATNHLIPFICSPEPTGRLAAEALTKLGQEPLVETFARIFSGRETEMPFSECPRASIVSALTRAVKFQFSAPAIHALVRIGAVEALPDLRRWQFMLPDEAKVICKQAIAQLDELNQLPRPADSDEVNAENLPRIAGSRAHGSHLLPRPADE